ncbi:LPO_1073/Vpar_1526 family protein [Williamsia muralis]|uniref:Uncharacterized protein n=1 Tax=Williamsia marianensis TaxID=85044 RepID=A0ABU4EVY9_WILMA|nr:LPO_1073/Vpar_1526 family protein [Williamsia muralis]MDV7135413.1 hypothetical protein [Williamsia muralis]
MKDEVQQAGDNATQINAATVVNNQINIQISDGSGLTDFLNKASLRTTGGNEIADLVEIARQAVREEFNSLLGQLVDATKDRPEYHAFATLRALAAVEEGQTAFAQADCDPAVGEDLGKLIIEIVNAEPRSLRERVLKEAMRCIPRLSAPQIDALAVIHIVAQVIFAEPPGSPEVIVKKICEEVAPFLPSSCRFVDYQYMAACGLGMVSNLGFYSNAFETIRRSHTYWLQTGVPRDVILEVGEHHLKQLDDGSFVVSENAVAIQTDNSIPEITSKLSNALESTLPSVDQLTEMFRAESTEITDGLIAMATFNAYDFALTAIGAAIGNIRWHSVSDKAMDFDFLVNY